MPQGHVTRNGSTRNRLDGPLHRADVNPQRGYVERQRVGGIRRRRTSDDARSVTEFISLYTSGLSISPYRPMRLGPCTGDGPALAAKPARVFADGTA